MASDDGLIPVIINLDGDTRTSTVVLLNENAESFDEVAEVFYTALRPNIPEFFLQSGERTITKMYVDWEQGQDRFLPTSTEVTGENIKAVARMLRLRGGKDMLRMWLNEIE